MRPDSGRLYNFLKTRSLVVQAIRDFFTRHTYLEVDTPLLCPTIIPEAQIDPIFSEGNFLQASPEMCMKRLLSKGFDKIFQICKSFRKNERGIRHLPEFTILEWYTKGHTYLDLMNQCFELINFIASELNRGDAIYYQGKAINLSQPWPKMTVKDAFDLYSETPLKTALNDDTFDEIISFKIEPNLGNSAPLFLCDYPAQLASLASLLPDNQRYAQRFELYIAGLELANGFTELTDPQEQKQRFEKENQIRHSYNKRPIPMPDSFLNDLENMPDAAGIALGLDRLVMIFCDTPSIDDVIAFTPETL